MQDAFDYALAERDRRMLEEAHVEVSTAISKLGLQSCFATLLHLAGKDGCFCIFSCS
jgi:hypothetical protein